VRAVAGDFPDIVDHYSGQFTVYDIMGRAIQQTNPTEMTNLGGPPALIIQATAAWAGILSRLTTGKAPL